MKREIKAFSLKAVKWASMEARSPTGVWDREEMGRSREAPLGLVCVDPPAWPSELSLPSFSSSQREATLSHFISGGNARSKVEHADARATPVVCMHYCSTGMYRMRLQLKQLIFLTPIRPTSHKTSNKFCPSLSSALFQTFNRFTT